MKSSKSLSYPLRILVSLVSVLCVSVGQQYASGAGLKEYSVSELASGSIPDDTHLMVRGYVVGLYDLSAKSPVLGLPSGADAKAGRSLVIADSREATLSDPLCFVKLSSDGTTDDINLQLHPETYLGELCFSGNFYMYGTIPRVDYTKNVTDYSIGLYDPSQGGGDLPQPQQLYIEGEVNGMADFRRALLRSGADLYSAVISEGLSGRWTISGDQWRFGAADDSEPLKAGETTPAWFGGKEFVSDITGAVRVTFRYVMGSANSGSTVPSSLSVEPVGTGEGTAGSPYTVGQVLGMAGEWTGDEGPSGVYVRGYIAGHISKDGEAVFGPYDETSKIRELLLGDDPDESDPGRLIGVQLSVGGTQKQDIGLAANPGHMGHGLLVRGDLYTSVRGTGFAGVGNITDYRIIPCALHASWGDPAYWSCPLESIPGGFMSLGFDVAAWRDVRQAMTGSPEGTADDGYGHLMLSLSGADGWPGTTLSYGREAVSDTVRLDRTATATIPLKVYPASSPCTEAGHIVLPSGEYFMHADTDTFTPTLTLTRQGATVGHVTVISDADNGDTETWHTLTGVSLPGRPTVPGIYIRRSGTKSRKIIIR